MRKWNVEERGEREREREEKVKEKEFVQRKDKKEEKIKKMTKTATTAAQSSSNNKQNKTKLTNGNSGISKNNDKLPSFLVPFGYNFKRHECPCISINVSDEKK